MKILIRNLIFFSLPIVILLAGIEIYLRNIPNVYSYKNNYLIKHSSEIEVLYLGNSHIYYGINPEMSNFRSFNLAHISQSLDLDLALLNNYKESLSNLKCIVIPVDYFSLRSNLGLGVENWRIKNYEIYYKLNTKLDYSHKFEIFNGKFKDHVDRLLLNEQEKNIKDYNSLGWGTDYVSQGPKTLEEIGAYQALKNTLNYDFNTVNENIQILNTFVRLAETEKFEIIFVTCPVYQSYYQHINKAQFTEMETVMHELTKKKQHISYYNFFKSSKFNEHDFYDGDHLNHKGAEKFTHLLDSIISIKIHK